jgi:hypothetical protein
LSSLSILSGFRYDPKKEQKKNKTKQIQQKRNKKKQIQQKKNKKKQKEIIWETSLHGDQGELAVKRHEFFLGSFYTQRPPLFRNPVELKF